LPGSSPFGKREPLAEPGRGFFLKKMLIYKNSLKRFARELRNRMTVVGHPVVGKTKIAQIERAPLPAAKNNR
jgi:hypothetical protein